MRMIIKLFRTKKVYSYICRLLNNSWWSYRDSIWAQRIAGGNTLILISSLCKTNIK